MALLDTDSVVAYLSEHLPRFEGPLEAQQFPSGQSNPTFLIRASSGTYVLRRKPPGILLKSAHAVDREFRVQSALAGSAVPVAKMHLFCEDDSVIGSAFYVMEHVEGRNLGDPRLPGMTPEERGAIYAEMNRVLAALHDVNIEAVGLSEYGPPGNYYERQIGRWSKQYRATETGPLPDMDALMDRLPDRIPAPDGQRTLVHGDYRIDNMIFDAESAQCRAILDWELSTVGHPYADLAAMVMQWHMPAGDDGRGLAGFDRAANGLPSDAEFIAAYCERRSLSGIPDFGFYLAFCFFRIAAILQGVKKRALDGNASNPELGLRYAAVIPQLASKGLDVLDNA